MRDDNGEAGWRTIVSWTGSLILGGVLVFAAVGKLADPVLFVEQIRHEGLAVFFSANTVAVIALALEMVLGTALLLGVRNIRVLIPTSALVAFFLFLTGRNYYLVLVGRRDPDYDCGCFGVFLERTATEAFWQDLFLLVPPLLMAFASRKAVWSKLSFWKLGLSSAAAAALVLYVIFGVGLPAAGGGETPVEMEAGFRPSSQFSLWMNGEPVEEARIFESDLSLEILIVAERLPRPILIDVRTSSFSTLPPSAVRTGAEGAEVSEGADPVETGEFQVGSEGLQLELDGRQVQLKSGG